MLRFCKFLNGEMKFNQWHVRIGRKGQKFLSIGERIKGEGRSCFAPDYINHMYIQLSFESKGGITNTLKLGLE